MIRIDKGIAAPEKRDCGRRAVYPFRHMQVGDSFFAPVRKVCPATWSQVTGFKFSTAGWIEDGIKGVRVWRIA